MTSPCRVPMEYWEGIWQSQRLSNVWRYDEFMRGLDRLPGSLMPQKGSTLIEVGCGGSHLLPYFAKMRRVEVEGIDYAPTGCLTAATLLEVSGVPPMIHLGDMFNPPLDLLGRYDTVISAGVVEHYEDTAGALKSVAAFAKTGGRVITTVPNLSGWTGDFMRRFTPDNYNNHVVLTRRQLHKAHRDAGLNVLHCDYFLTVNPNVVRWDLIFGTKMTRVVGKAGAVVSRVVNATIRMRTRRLSPYILCVAETA